MKLISPDFENYEHIPMDSTCDGYDLSPALEILNVPKKAKSLILCIDDPDAAGGELNHWIMWNIRPDMEKIKKHHVPEGAVVGVNSFGKNKYKGPCPPGGTHVYIFKLCALDISLPNDPALTKRDVEKLAKGHILEKSVLKGYYERVI